MSIKTLSTSARVLNSDGFETQNTVEVAIHRDGDGGEYIRVGSALYWRKDVLESEDRLECLASGSVILL